MCLFSLIKYINVALLFMSFIYFVYIVIVLKNYSKIKQRTKDVITEYCVHFILNEIFINLLSVEGFLIVVKLKIYETSIQITVTT